MHSSVTRFTKCSQVNCSPNYILPAFNATKGSSLLLETRKRNDGRRKLERSIPRVFVMRGKRLKVRGGIAKHGARERWVFFAFSNFRGKQGG